MKSTPPYSMTERERANLQRMIDYSSVNSLAEVWAIASRQFSQIPAIIEPHAKPEVSLTYGQLYQQMQQFAAGVQALGVQVGDRICLFADNSSRWLIADQGMMLAGAVDVVRSAQADKDELLYIIDNSGSTGLVVEDIATLQKVRSGLDALPLKFVILLSAEEPPAEEGFNVLNYPQLMELGSSHSLQPVEQNLRALATLIYTSGTTGRPKGVMLSHGNLLHQVSTLGVVLQPKPGSRILAILPTWHAYERSCEYFLFSQGCTQIYTNLRNVKTDLKKYKPNYMVGVPRLWESIYEGVERQFREQPPKKQKLVNNFLAASGRYIEAKRTWQGLNLANLNPSLPQRLGAAVQMAMYYPVHRLGEQLVYKKVREATGGEIFQVISGGGSLAKHLDTFFEIVGIEILVGYGLTETAPVTNARRPWRNLRGSAGQPIPGTEIKIVDPQTRQPLPVGERGLVLIRGPQVMQGYYNNNQATAKAIDAEGWFDSGDLGWVTPDNDLVLTGRAKDTIVLTNGENIEPQPLEDACLRSPYIDQIMLVGQDQRSLGALIVPNTTALEQWAQETNQANLLSPQLDLGHKAIQELIRQELNREVKNRPGYRADDRIGPFRLIAEPFSIDNGMMTQTLKIKRPVVSDRYRDMINGMFE
ncbi:long-chain fatty acid--CoA ligase [Desertifilum sp. FACHB-1129]|uniref:Long-chain fatty acid--CoA ligase n=1 Tax=Desertifilum tharense IPPAS B-1220 TaxID=1781255 RepID=A0A1E5QI26_9CYAN|nr:MULTISPECIES: long-chain fatty acid--CoA ligase [Desertifilum]MDA0209457.1 long-chain fatty acid--CoA ligase [Cyanobacteria bacterium FC1]MBD2314336.1 long-chain fatty acid--CoA ligase [Desertifilum sp. FACHB-1129]MBD2324613.1 long-chain fatty acid--CoA ligase [Desertifilum sp. FACHB-866]MBD2334704.1 long-chain fatty acid--CoA ligase [Desertifilum sp. FACHB-868]OEJ74271.1 long-chain fatty acid--CoA ligase [Desertifilum tharense IPPAS B-1220]